MKRLAVVLAAVSMTLFLARCGGGGPEAPDASAPVRTDAAQVTGDGGTLPTGDGSTTLPGDGSTPQADDASTTQPSDGSTTQPTDGSTTQPADGSTTQPADGGTTQPADGGTAQPNDGGTPGACDPFAQTGCTGQKCSLDQTGAYVCVAAGTKTDQQDCTQESDCAAGLACVQITGEATMKCRAFCNATKKCVTGQACVVGAPGGTSAILCAVIPVCNPFATPTGCTGTQKCTLADDTPTWACGPAGTKTDLATCANDGECAAGLVCLDFSDGPKCHALCSDSQSKACPTGQSCLGGSETSTEAFACLPTPACNPLTQDCAGANEGCFPKSQTEWACFNSMGKAAGAACTYANDCIEGYACAGNPGTCMQVCDPAGGAPTCTSPKTCAGFVTPAGVCN